MAGDFKGAGLLPCMMDTCFRKLDRSEASVSDRGQVEGHNQGSFCSYMDLAEED